MNGAEVAGDTSSLTQWVDNVTKYMERAGQAGVTPTDIVNRATLRGIKEAYGPRRSYRW